MKTKNFKHSKVLWLNTIILIFALVDKEFLAVFNVSESVTTMIIASMAKVTAIANIVGRIFFTKTAISFKQ